VITSLIGEFVGIDVLIIINDSELSEETLRTAWLAAQAIFKNYGIEVYVIPYYNPKSSRTVVIVNDVEYVISRRLSVNEFIDLVLSSSMIKEGAHKESLAIGMTFNDKDPLSDAVVIA